MLYVYVSTKPWDALAFERRRASLPGEWVLARNNVELASANIAVSRPRYIFFKHWSERVSDEFLKAHECVCFHASDVPFGRGGSPIQNLIARGFAESKLTALRMTSEIDAGPVYLKRSVSLEGSAQEIFERMAELSLDMAIEIVGKEPKAVEQEGEVVVFKRRTPEQSRIIGNETLAALYRHIRMLDAESYPRAFLDVRNLRLTFRDAHYNDGRLSACVDISSLANSDEK